MIGSLPPQLATVEIGDLAALAPEELFLQPTLVSQSLSRSAGGQALVYACASGSSYDEIGYPSDLAALAPTIDKAVERGIPVVTLMHPPVVSTSLPPMMTCAWHFMWEALRVFTVGLPSATPDSAGITLRASRREGDQGLGTSRVSLIMFG